MVQVGSDTTFTQATSGRTAKGGVGIFGEAIANYYVSGKKAEAACDAVGGDDRWALAEVWRAFNVTGSNRRYADLKVSGNWRTAWSAFGSASSSLRLKVFLKDLSNGNIVDEFTLLTEGGQYVDYNTNNNSYNRSVSGYLYPNRTYRIGIRAETWATALGSGTATADIHRSGNFNGYIHFDSIKLDWI